MIGAAHHKDGETNLALARDVLVGPGLTHRHFEPSGTSLLQERESRLNASIVGAGGAATSQVFLQR